MLTEQLEARCLPRLLADGALTAAGWPARRAEIMEILKQELFGVLPEKAWTQSCELTREENHFYHGGRSVIRDCLLTVNIDGQPFSWRFWYSFPKSDHPVPLVLLPVFPRLFPVDSVPAEEICDRGYGVCCFDYTSVSSDDGDFTSGLAKLFYPDGQRGPHDGGKIALWAWATSRILDELLKVPELDPRRILIAGHSRLGKTALWAGACDERFGGVISVQSGCAGAAIARGNSGEKVGDIAGKFPFWFAPAYASYAGRETEMPFDQHFLLAMAAPRPLYVTSAAGDLWADPLGEYLCCEAVSPVYALLGKKPFPGVEELSDSMAIHGGDIGYGRRPGTHFFSRHDWQHIMDFFDARAGIP